MSTEITIIFLFAALLAGAALGFAIDRLISRSTKTAEDESLAARLADKDATSKQLKEDLDTERRIISEERQAASEKAEGLTRQLQEALEARARMEGANDTLEALKEEHAAKANEINDLTEKIRSLSSDLSHHKTVAEEANRAKNDALIAKAAEVERLIKEKETACQSQINDVRNACQRELTAKETATAAQVQAIRDHCKAQLEEKETHIEEQKRLLAAAEARLTQTFDALSMKALGAVSEQFMKTAKATLEVAQTEAKGDLKLRQQAIEELLKPVSETMAKLQAQHEEMEQKRVSAFDAIEKGLLTISQETDLLANALRKPLTRGAWGEMNLKVILDNAGLSEGVHYDLQDSTEDDEGTRLRTDVIIHLPNGRDFIIDSKAPLEAYWDGMNAADEATKQAKFLSHARLVRDHVKRLSAKSYWTRYKAAPDLVVMFIPTEGAYQAALEADPSLLTDAHSSRIYLANPMTLVNMIHVTAYVLKEEASKQNAHEIQATASELYDRLSKFVGKFADLGRSLRISLGKYNDAVGSLEGRVLPQARKVNSLGVGSHAPIPSVPLIEVEPRSLISPEALDYDPTKELALS